jgi:SAM-dependent methyltransferase
MKERTCPLCAGRSPAVLFAESNVDPARLNRFAYASRKVPEYMHLRLMLCKSCDLLYASPAPEVADLTESYSEADFDSGVESARAARTYGRILRKYLDRLPDRSGALDIGTGDGAFLHELLAAGFDNVEGIEPSAAPIAAADPKVRNLIRHGIFESARFAPESFSLITCFQTIEHVREPLALCRDIHGLLKPKGAVCLVGHNRRALSARLLGRKSPIFDIEHLQLFSPQSLRQLLSEADFSDIQVFPIWNQYPLSYWARLFPLPSILKRAAISALASTGIGRLPLALPAGNLAAIAFRS